MRSNAPSRTSILRHPDGCCSSQGRRFGTESRDDVFNDEKRPFVDVGESFVERQNKGLSRSYEESYMEPAKPSGDFASEQAVFKQRGKPSYCFGLEGLFVGTIWKMECECRANNL